MTYTFRNDQPDIFLSILREVGQWLLAGGQTLWKIETLTADNLFDDFTRDNCYVMYVDEESAATFILQWTDPLYFADVPDHTAGFIHKLAVRRKFAGQHLFKPVLDFCRAGCMRRGIRQIQLETDATRPALMRFYEGHGFQPTDQKTIHEFGQTFTCQYYVLDF